MPMIRYGVLGIEPVVSAMQSRALFISFMNAEGESLSVPLSSLRLQTYTKGVTCVACGLEGSFFAAEESFPRNTTPTRIMHFNLYAMKNGKEVMMTSDHIRPLWAGGSNSVENRQPMCCKCNEKKAHKVDDPDLLITTLTNKIKEKKKELADFSRLLNKHLAETTSNDPHNKLRNKINNAQNMLRTYRGELVVALRKKKDATSELVLQEACEAHKKDLLQLIAIATADIEKLSTLYGVYAITASWPEAAIKQLSVARVKIRCATNKLTSYEDNPSLLVDEILTRKILHS